MNSSEIFPLTILHTNDIHGRLDALTRLSHLARRQRTEAEAEGRYVLLWDAGDAADRRFEPFSLTKGAAMSDILNAMGVELQTVGNAITLPYGPQAMAEVARRAHFPLLAANLRDQDGPLVKGVQERVTLRLPGGPTLGVFGLTAPWGNFYETFDLRLPDFIDVARKQVASLQEEGAGPIVLLSHLGLEDDRRVAAAVPGIDLIIGAHSHSLLPEGEEENGVLIVQAGEYGQALGRVDLDLNARNGTVLSRSARVFQLPDDEPADLALITAIRAIETEIKRLKAQPVGVLLKPLNADFYAECGIGNLAADALRQRLGADAAIIAGGQLLRGLRAGTVTRGDLNAACFSTANPCLTVVTGDQIQQALARGLDPEIARFEHHGFRGAPVGHPQISGLRVFVNPGNGGTPRIQRVEVNDQPLEPEGSYRLAHTDAEMIPDVGYLVLDEEQETAHEVPTILGEVMAEYLAANSPLPPPASGRWIIQAGT